MRRSHTYDPQRYAWHYLPGGEGSSHTACGKEKNAHDVFNNTAFSAGVSCTACMKTDEYLAARMEAALKGPPT